MPRCDRWALRIQQLPTVGADMADAARLHFRSRPNVKKACMRAYGYPTLTMAQLVATFKAENPDVWAVLTGD